jgi:hypothetical protein
MKNSQIGRSEGAPRLFSYTIPVDDGAAPNPFRGMCSLAICKPAIRRVAKRDDWVAGLGSKNAPSGNLSGRLVYAMRVDEVLSLRDYDLEAVSRWPDRIPKSGSLDLSEKLGDCIYDYSLGTPSQRSGVHKPENVTKDLGGENVLLSWDFYYFGRQAKELPQHLREICHQTQGHRSDLNDPYVEDFVEWVRSLPPGMCGWPDFMFDWVSDSGCPACTVRRLDVEHDPPC